MKILIADDHRLIVEAVADKLAELGPDTRCLRALSVTDLLAQVSDDLALALIDLSMPGAEGLSHVQEVHRRHPELPIIVLSGHEDPITMRQALDSGAMGYIPKAYSPDVMLSAVRLVLAGGVYVPPMMIAGALGGVAPTPPARPTTAGLAAEPLALPASDLPFHPSRHALTERQVEVLHLLSEGRPNKMIARGLGISEGTVKIHLAAIFRALGVRNRTEAVVAARALRDSAQSPDAI